MVASTVSTVVWRRVHGDRSVGGRGGGGVACVRAGVRAGGREAEGSFEEKVWD